ncbi:MAG: sugar ABC transporter permease [Clostridiales bacterium]|jgi:ABC-type sugar transport system permease subunit|nr:sugar ABC transporter permease [Clostridiales bacterium]
MSLFTSKKHPEPFFRRDQTQAVLMLLPMLVGFLLFTYVPIIYILRFCMYSYDGILPGKFTGIDNFVRIFQRDKAFWEACMNTLVLGGKIILEIPLAMLFAVFLHKGLKGMAFFRVSLFLPTIISTAIVGLIFSLMFASFNGVINTILTNAGLIEKPVDWLGKKWSALMVLELASVWCYVGINMVFFLMALQSVPQELYECAALDGCTGFKRFFRITLPMIIPIFRLVLLNSIIGSLKINDIVLASTNGQPAGKTEVVMTYIFKFFFGYSTRRVEVGYASAMSVVVAVFLGLITLIYIKASKGMTVD